MRSLVALAFVLMLALASCTARGDEATDAATASGGASASAAQSYSVFMGAHVSVGRGIGFAGFYPATLAIHPGDSVTFYNLNGFTALHTVTFGARDTSVRPPVVVDREANPVVADGCFAASPAREPTCEASGSWTTLPAYDGRGFWNSGFVSDYGAVELATAPSIAPGSYGFRCLIHPSMTGVLTVVPSSEPIDPPTRVRRLGLERSNDAKLDIASLTRPVLGRREVAAGWGTDSVFVDRFAPSRIAISAGDEVTWSVTGFHDVTFDPVEGAQPESSGPLLDGSRYAVAFSVPGVYRYHCSLHVRMTGVVVVR
jgi:plastocyanin